PATLAGVAKCSAVDSAGVPYTVHAVLTTDANARRSVSSATGAITRSSGGDGGTASPGASTIPGTVVISRKPSDGAAAATASSAWARSQTENGWPARR